MTRSTSSWIARAPAARSSVEGGRDWRWQPMASQIVDELRATTDAVWARLRAQLNGMEPYMERSDAPGEWTTRQVLSHLLFEDGWKPVPVLESFANHDLPLIEINPGLAEVTPERQKMTLKEFIDALDAQRHEV